MMTPTFYPNSLVNETLIGLNMSLFAAFCFLMKICESFDFRIFSFLRLLFPISRIPFQLLFSIFVKHV